MVLGRNGVIAAEEYYNDGEANTIHDVRSVTKSVMGLLVGIAIREGFINSVDQTIGEFLEETVEGILDSVKAQITIEQLLTMSCGLRWHELNGGKYNQKQIVPAEWVNQTTSIQNSTNDFNPYCRHYSYLWWVGQAHGHDLFFAMGWGGQFIVCVPDLNLVVAATCKWRGVSSGAAGMHWYDIFIIIMDNIVPAVGD